jgi:D-glycero-D-manno-heptose 1,7-bisphosphate phosphatase
MKKRAVFLDRDGTINVDVGYPRDFGQIAFFPGTIEAIRKINAAGFLAVVVSNQSGVGRGFFSEEDLRVLHDRLKDALAAGGARLDAIYYCPHYDQSADARYRGTCACRKPAPGLAERAARDLGVDPAASYMIGDKVEDIQFGRAIGAAAVLVRTGYGEGSVVRLRELRIEPAHVARGILEAVDWILEREAARRQ